MARSIPKIVMEFARSGEVSVVKEVLGLARDELRRRTETPAGPRKRRGRPRKATTTFVQAEERGE